MRRVMMGILCAALVAGCGTKGDNPTAFVPVKGKVVAGGKTLSWVEVRMYPTKAGGTMTYGIAGADGVVTFKSMDDKAGSVPGKYKVTVEGWRTKGSVPPTLPAKYADESSTDIVAEVPSGGGEIVITLP